MLKKLEKKRRVLELGFALGFALTVLLTAFAAHRRQVADRVCGGNTWAASMMADLIPHTSVTRLPG